MRLERGNFPVLSGFGTTTGALRKVGISARKSIGEIVVHGPYLSEIVLNATLDNPVQGFVRRF